MKKLIYLIGLVIFSSCNVFYHMPNAADDVYYSRKANSAKPVLTPKVDVDSIIKAHPPQYGTPMNRITDDNSTANPLAEKYYPQYKAYWDSVYRAQPWLSGYYVNTTPPPFDEREAAREARRARREQFWSNSNWGFGIGVSPYWGWNTGIGWGWNNWGWNRNRWWGWNTWYSPYWGWGSPWPNTIGWGWYDPWWGWGPGWYYDPWWGWGPGWWYVPPANNNNSDNNTPSQPRPRQQNNAGGSSFNPSTANGGNMRTIPPINSMDAPATPQNEQMNVRPISPNTPRLVDVNGRQIYVPATPGNNTLRGYDTYAPSQDASIKQQQLMPAVTPNTETFTAPVQRNDNTRMRSGSFDTRNNDNFSPTVSPPNRSNMPTPSGGMRGSGGSTPSGSGGGGGMRPRR